MTHPNAHLRTHTSAYAIRTMSLAMTHDSAHAGHAIRTMTLAMTHDRAHASA